MTKFNLSWAEGAANMIMSTGGDSACTVIQGGRHRFFHYPIDPVDPF